MNLPELLEHRVVEECVSLFNSNGTQEDTEEQACPEVLSPICGSAGTLCCSHRHGYDLEDGNSHSRRLTDQDDTPYKWSDYVHKVSSIILARHGNAHRIVCVNDPYNTAYSTKDDERDLRVQGRAHVPNIYMKLGNPFPSAREHSRAASVTRGGCKS